MLHALKPAHGATHRAKRVGRGDSSGHGKTATRGAKGQKARTGGKRGLNQFAVRGMVLRTPKLRGFKSIHEKLATVPLDRLIRSLGDQAIVTPAQLAKLGLINTNRYGVKIVGTAKISKPLTIKAHGFSRTAKAAIEAGGGKAEKLRLR